MAITVVTYHWDFGDGDTSDLANPTHTYYMAGEYTVTLTVLTSDGVTTTATTTVYGYENSYASGMTFIAAPPDGGWADIGGGIIGARQGLRVTTKSGSCFRFAIPQERSQGFGWSEYNGREWVWPMGMTGACKVLDDNDEPIILITDGRTFRTYQIDRKDWWQDGGNEDYAGAEINTDLLLREHVPPIEASAKIKHSESYAGFRPWYKERRNVSDYGEHGFRDSFRASMYFREDSSPDDRAVVRYFPRKAQIVSDRHIESESLQAGLRITGAPWRLPSVQQWFEQIDTAAAPPEKQMSEKTWAELLGNPLVWIGRSNELVNPTTGVRTMPWDKGTNARTVGSFAGTATGPDGKDRSGVVFAAADSMAVTQDIPAGDMSMILWVRSPTTPCVLLTDTTVGLTVSLVQTADGWELRWDDGINTWEVPISMALTQWTMLTVVRRGDTMEVYENAAFANTRPITEGLEYGGTLTLYGGAVIGFEPMIVPARLTSDAVAWIYNDVTQNEGNSVCAMY